MAFEDYDTEFGYSLTELRNSYGRKAYEVPDYEMRSLEEIEMLLDGGKYAERGECSEHLKYLEDVQKRLSMIALAEEREGIMNWELREVLERTRRTFVRLSALYGQLPVIVVYKADKANTIQPSTQLKPGITEFPVKIDDKEPLM